MKKNIAYRILTYILLIPAIILSIMVLILVGPAFANPSLLIVLFMVACVAIYTFTSFNFLLQGVDKNKRLNPSARDWIKVNAIVTIVFAILMLLSSYTLFTQPGLVSDTLDQVRTQYPSADITEEGLIKSVQSMMLAFGIYSLLLLVHIFITFRLLKQLNFIFVKKDGSN